MGASTCVSGGVATALLFGDDDVVTATDPAGAAGFSLRDGSAELRRLFLHALARFGESETTFVAKGNQRPFAGVSANAGDSDALFAPLLAPGRTLGVVAVHVDGEVDPEERAVLAKFCHVVTKMLDSQRALVAARRQSRDSHLLAMVNERLHRSLDRRDVLFGIVEGVRSAFGADRAMVLERIGEADHANIVASAVMSGAQPMQNRTVALDADLRKVFAGLTVRRDEFHGSDVYGAEARSAMVLPFVVDGHVEDALVVSFSKQNGFDDADLSALRSLAFHVGLALSNARLYERERTRRSQAETLERVVRILRDTQYVEEVLLVFVVTVSHELPIDCFTYSLEGDELVRRALRLREPRAFEPSQRIPRAFLEPFLAVDEPSDAALVPHLARHQLWGDRGGAIVPLRIDGALWGCFVVRGADTSLDWPPDERATFFRTLGSHLEITLANARAYERELKRARERETLAEAARSILGHTAIGSLADVMSRMAATLLSADRACVLRWTGDRYAIVGSHGEGVEDTVARSGIDLAQRAERFATLASDERRVQRLIDGPGYVVIPLSQTSSVDGEAIDAFLLVGRSGDERFGRDDLRILQELGALLALALQNLELYEAMGFANRALSESSEFKDDLLAMLAHDFKGPLTVIMGYCEVMLEGEGDGEFRDEIEQVHEQTQRLVRLSEDALILAQTQSQGFSLARSAMELGSFVAECVEDTAPNNPRVKVQIAPDPIPVELDTQRFRHVTDNLISNALKYSSADVWVRVSRDGGVAKIEVTDTGIGIPRDEVGSLFTRFGRASNARSRGISGSGIGLYVARKVVEAHGGALTVHSIEHEGSTFVVTLPTLAPRVEETTRSGEH
jgi:signal transduction histidine kinase